MKRLIRTSCLLLLFAAGGCSSLRQAVQNRECALDSDRPYDVVEIDPERHVVQLYWRDPQGQPFLTLERFREWLADRADSLVAATNGGIYEPGYVPTGLFVENGAVRIPLNLRTGDGNFYLKPNGVFALTADGVLVVEASEYEFVTDSVRYALQSGPLLVDGGAIHPAFNRGSVNCRLRSGIGVRPDGHAFIAISNGAVNFFDFATFFRDSLGCEEALYLDGAISSLWAPGIGRFEQSRKKYAGILAVLAKSP